MSGHPQSKSDEFLKKFYQNHALVVSDQIRSYFPNNAVNHTSDSPDFAKLNANIESLTCHMKDVLRNESVPNSRAIRGRSDNDDIDRCIRIQFRFMHIFSRDSYLQLTQKRKLHSLITLCEAIWSTQIRRTC